MKKRARQSDILSSFTCTLTLALVTLSFEVCIIIQEWSSFWCIPSFTFLSVYFLSPTQIKIHLLQSREAKQDTKEFNGVVEGRESRWESSSTDFQRIISQLFKCSIFVSRYIAFLFLNGCNKGLQCKMHEYRKLLPPTHYFCFYGDAFTCIATTFICRSVS